MSIEGREGYEPTMSVRKARRIRTGVAHYGPHTPPQMTFAYIYPGGNRLADVVKADSIDAAWTIATGWGDAADIEDRKRQGWRLVPCIVEWELEE